MGAGAGAAAGAAISAAELVWPPRVKGTAAEAIRDDFTKPRREICRVMGLFGDGPFPFAAQVLSKQPEQLRSAGVSRPKANYIRGIAERAAFGSLPTLEECDRLTDAEILQRLTEMKGVGRWTVEMFLIFNLGRLDVLPVHDLGVRRGFQIASGKRKMPEPEQLERFGEKWRPYRTVAARYLWRAVDSM